MAESKWQHLQDQSNTTGGSDTTDARKADFKAKINFDSSEFFDCVDKEASNFGSMSASLERTLAHAQQQQATQQVSASMNLGMGGRSSSEDDEIES